MSPLGYLRSLRDERRRYGWGGFFKRRGWKFAVLFLAAYLVRDLILYVFIPLAVVAGLKR